jgi:uncharacterized protein YecA (UPF0149 family)
MVELSLILVFLGGLFAAFDSYAPPQKEPVRAKFKASFFFLTVAFKLADNKEQIKEDEFMPQPNDKCPCGSGKAYKDCCGKPK